MKAVRDFINNGCRASQTFAAFGSEKARARLVTASVCGRLARDPEYTRRCESGRFSSEYRKRAGIFFRHQRQGLGAQTVRLCILPWSVSIMEQRRVGC